MEFLHDISAYLEAILVSISANFWLAMLFIFLVCIGEAVFIVGLLVPSLPILLLTGGIIAQGGLPFWPIFFAATLGAIIGDAISYFVGWWLKDRIRTVWPFKNYLGLIAQGELFFQRHGGKAIFAQCQAQRRLRCVHNGKYCSRDFLRIANLLPGIAGDRGQPFARGGRIVGQEGCRALKALGRPVGAHAAGPDDGDLDAQRLEVPGQALGQAFQSELRCVVEG